MGLWPNFVLSEKVELHEIKKKTKPAESAVLRVGVEEWQLKLEEIIPPKFHGNFLKLVRITAYTIRLIRNLQRRLAKEVLVLGDIESEEYVGAKELWIREAQNSYGDKKGMHKAYIAPCASSRGTPPETVPDLSADKFISSLIRLKARRRHC